MSKNLTKRLEDYSKWYNELVVKADLAENSGVRGCMVIKPYGYAIWEKMQAELDRMFKETGHSNAYFPLFVPKSMFEAEEKNAEGFAKECAIVTHYRLKSDPDNKGKLLRPRSSSSPRSRTAASFTFAKSRPTSGSRSNTSRSGFSSGFTLLPQP